MNMETIEVTALEQLILNRTIESGFENMHSLATELKFANEATLRKAIRSCQQSINESLITGLSKHLHLPQSLLIALTMRDYGLNEGPMERFFGGIKNLLLENYPHHLELLAKRNPHTVCLQDQLN